MFDDITHSPLSWPATWPRTERHRRSRSAFGAHSIASSVAELHNEIRRMGGRHLIVSARRIAAEKQQGRNIILHALPVMGFSFVITAGLMGLLIG